MDIYRGIGPLFQTLKRVGDMGFHKMLSIIVVVIIFLYILYKLLQKRSEMIREKFTNSTVLSIQKANTLIPNIQNTSKNYYSKPLNQFYIMSAYGGGFDGYEITEDMILYTLSLGYRYIFIHVFFDVKPTGSTAMVGFSSIYSPMENIAQKMIPLIDFIELLEQNAFSTSSAPNPGDPFFLHILPAYQTGQDTTSKQRATGHNTQLNSQIEQALAIIQNTNRASGKIQPITPLRQIQGQLVIVMDETSTAGNMTDNLKNMISLNVPSSSIQKSPAYSASPPSPPSPSSSPSPSLEKMSIVLPFNESGTILNSLPPYKDLYNAKKWNITPVCPWESRFIFTISTLGLSNFGDYENMFYTEGSSAFIPLT
jgi:hypothetical protein